MTTSGGRRDPDAVRRGLDRWIAEHPSPLVDGALEDVSHPTAGWSNETLIVRLDSGRRVVVRLPPAVATFPDHDFLAQAAVAGAAGAAGLPVPSPVVVCDDESWVGSPFIVMPFVEGTIPGPASVFDPWLTEATPEVQRASQGRMIDVLAAIHRVDWQAAPALAGSHGLRGATDGFGLADEVAWWRSYLAWATDGSPQPRFVALLEWCGEQCPDRDDAPSLLWGDPRMENLIFDDDRLPLAVLDWEMATIGPAELDLGWYLGLERVLRELTGGMRVPGFRGDDEFVADYGHALGREVHDIAWHQIFAIARSVCINVRQAAISAAAGVAYVLPGDDTNPLLPIVEGWIERT